MQRTKSILLNFIFFLQVLLLFLVVIENRIEPPVWLEVAGRLHPVVLHLPIGFLIFFTVLLFAESAFKKKAYKKILLVVLLSTSLAASLTALFGFFLSQQGDYGTDALSQHKISGVLLSIVCYTLLLIFERPEQTKALFLSVSVLAIGTLLFTGHTGGILTHGENYVFAPLNNAEESMPKDPTTFRKVVYPILEKKCVSCHNESKAKGKLVMTSIADFKKGGKKGVEWVSGKPEESRMIKYIHLPVEDDDHMPPDGKPQLTVQEIEVLKIWIKLGVDFASKYADLKDTDSLKIVAASISPVHSLTESKVYEFEAVSDDVIKKLNTPFRSVFPLFQNSPALQADFFIKESFQAKALEELREIKDQLVVLNLSKMPVTDQDLSIIGEFKNLERINLNFSKVNGQGLSSLKSLKNLSSISLAGTNITAESLKPVTELPDLKELFVWNTEISPEEKSKLTIDHPKIAIATTQFKDDRVLKLSRPIVVNEGIVGKNEPVVLKHSMPGVTIRYTLDGSQPDSTSSAIFEKPLTFESAFKVRAIACKQGWYCSDTFEMTYFVEGFKPERATLLTPVDKQYPGEGSKSLTDGRKGFTDVLKEPSWLGFRDNAFAAEFEFGNTSAPVRKIVLSYAQNIGGYIFPPTEVEIWAGQNKQQLKLIKSLKPPVPKEYLPQRTQALEIPLESGASYTLYKIIAKPIDKLPPWHSGKGKKGWFFLDEVFFY